MAEYIKELVDMLWELSFSTSLLDYFVQIQPDDIQNLIWDSLKDCCLMLGRSYINFETMTSPPVEFQDPLWKKYVVVSAQVAAFEKYKQRLICEQSYTMDALGVVHFYSQEELEEIEAIGEYNCDPYVWAAAHYIPPWDERFRFRGEDRIRQEKNDLWFSIVRLIVT